MVTKGIQCSKRFSEWTKLLRAEAKICPKLHGCDFQNCKQLKLVSYFGFKKPWKTVSCKRNILFFLTLYFVLVNILCDVKLLYLANIFCDFKSLYLANILCDFKSLYKEKKQETKFIVMETKPVVLFPKKMCTNFFSLFLATLMVKSTFSHRNLKKKNRVACKETCILVRFLLILDW